MSRDAFDLFAGLESLSKGDLGWYDGLSDDGKKAASPLVIMRWLSGTSDPAQLIALNSFANRYVFPLGQEKALLFKLLAASTTGRSKRYFWLKGPGSTSKKLALQVAMEYYGWSAREAELQPIPAEDLLVMAEELGWDAEQIKKLKKELE